MNGRSLTLAERWNETASGKLLTFHRSTVPPFHRSTVPPSASQLTIVWGDICAAVRTWTPTSIVGVPSIAIAMV